MIPDIPDGVYEVSTFSYAGWRFEVYFDDERNLWSASVGVKPFDFSAPTRSALLAAVKTAIDARIKP